MSVDKEMRMERINRLIHELRYELERGFMEGEIEESITWHHIIPVSREVTNGVVVCRLETRPVHRDSAFGQQLETEPRLRVVRD